jgi:hypothetical protein
MKFYKNDIYEPDFMAFITILNSVKTAFFTPISFKDAANGQTELSRYYIHSEC